MRKITIPVSAVLALSAIQVAQAETIKVDFTKATAEQQEAISQGTSDVTLNGFTFACGNKCTLNFKNGVGASYTLGGRSMVGKRYVKFTPEKNGTLTYNVSNGKTYDVYSVVATASIDCDKTRIDAGEDASSIVAKNTLASRENKTFSVDIVAGQTYYILASESSIIYSISYEEAAPAVSNAYEEKTLTIKNGKESASTEITLQAGTYKFEGPEDKTLTVKQGDVMMADNGNVLIAANNTKVSVTIAGSKVSKDTDVKFKYTLMESSLASVRKVYTQKVAVMINKANVYTNDARLQANAVEASQLMSEVNGMGLEQYNEYMTSGKIAVYESKISSLSAKIDNNKAAYDGYAYAQNKLGNTYSAEEAKWVRDETLTGSLLAKKDELDAAYNKANESNKDDAEALASLKEVYDNAIKELDGFISTIDSEYAAGNQTNLDTYKALINTRVGSVKTDKVEASGVMGALDEAKNAIENGDDNAMSHANVNTALVNAKTVYDNQANMLYKLLADNTDRNDGDTYRDMYLEALGKLNEYLRTINEVKADNETLFGNKQCTKETQAALVAKLGGIIGDAPTIGNVYSEYYNKATTLRGNYDAALNDITDNATNYLKTNIKDVIGNRTEVNTYYDAQIRAIDNKIAALKQNVEDANAKHTIKGTSPFCVNYDTDLAAIRKDVDDIKANVKTSADEWDAWTASKAVVNGLQTNYNNQKNGNKDLKITGVTKTVSKDKVYSQATKFSVEYEATIQQRITDLLNAVNAAFKADGTGTSRLFNTDTLAVGKTDDKGVVTLYGSNAITKNIKGYVDDAKDCMKQYEDVVAALASYDLALNGKAAVGEEDKEGYVPAVLGLKDVATNLDVTIDGKYNGKSYRQYISEIETKIGAASGLKKQLNDAVALNDTAHVKAMKALKTFNDLVADITAKQKAYATNETKWNAEQLKQAKKSMLAEAERRVGLIDTQNAIANDNYTDGKDNGGYYVVVDEKNKNTNTTSYEFNTYGKRIDDWDEKDKDGKDVPQKGLASLLADCNAAVDAIKAKITTAKDGTDDAAAIAVLSEVVNDLNNAEGQYKTLSEKAAKYKTEYSAEKAARKTLLEAIRAKDGINDQLAKVKFEKEEGKNMFADEVEKQTTAITNQTKDIEAKFKEETVVANKEALTKAQNAISTAITNLQGLVAAEKANKTANDNFVKKDGEVNIVKAESDANDAIAKDVTDKKVVLDSDAYTYYTTQLKKYRNEYDFHYGALTTGEKDESIIKAQTDANAAVRKVYEADGKILSGALDKEKYTDPAKNMTKQGANLETKLTQLKEKIAAVEGQLVACEAAYAEQTTAADNLDKLRTEVFGIITGAETSTYHGVALAELKSIDADIAAYKTAVKDDYKAGTNSTDKVNLEAKANNANTRLTTLKNGWNDEYTKAVATDNQVRKQAFDDAYTALTAAYASDVDVIARLSKLSYADQFEGQLTEVVGKDGIYSYADKIRALKSRAEAAYAATVAPTLFDGGQKFKKEAADMQATINEKTATYTEAVNKFAEEKYNTEKSTADSNLKKAKDDVRDKLGSAFVNADFLAEAFSDVQQILDDAQGYDAKDENGNFKYADFAEILDKTILPAFATIDSKITADKENAAVKSYNDRLTEYRTLANSEAQLIAGYNGTDGKLGAYSEQYAKFIENSLDAAEAVWALIPEGKKFDNYKVTPEGATTSVYSALRLFGRPSVHPGYNKDDKTQPAEWAVKHTSKFWTAFDADQEYHANDNAYATMQTSINDVQAALDKAEAFVASLIIRNNSTVTNRLDIAQTAIGNLATEAQDYHDRGIAKYNLAAFNEKCEAQIAAIEAITNDRSGALSTEKTAVATQIGFLQHDYNQAAAVNIDNEAFSTEYYKAAIADFTAKNNALFAAFSTGKVDDKGAPIYGADKQPVYATAEETRQAYIALETEIGKMKSELTALYNEAAAGRAQEAVQAEIDKLTATYDEFVAQLADCHTPVIEEYQPQVDAFKANIDALQAVLSAEVADNTVLLYQDENITTAGKIANSVDGLKTAIDNKEKPYDVNDAKYIELLGQLNSITEELERVKAEVDEYKHKQTGVYDFDINGDREISEDEKFTTYIDKFYALYSYRIAQDKEWLDGKNADYKLVEGSELSPYSANDLKSWISGLEKTCSHFNASSSIPSLDTAFSRINSLGYTDADRAALQETYADLNTAVTNVRNYEKEANSGYVNNDIDGNEIWIEVDGKQKRGKSVVYMEEYPAIMARIAELATQVADLEQAALDKSWIKGDVDHNGKITVADYDAVRQMVLEQLKYTETDAMFYAADVNWDGLVNIGDVTMIGSNIMEGKAFPEGPAGTSSVAMAKGMAAGVPTYGNLALTAEGSGLAQTIRVAVDSRLGFVGGQFDVVLPKGVKLVSVASSSHDALMGEVDGAFRVLVSNLENTEIVNGQAFVELNVEVTSDYDGGGIEVRNVKFADADGTVFNLAKSSISTPTSLTNLTTTEKIQSKVYTVGGMLMNKVKKGINIIVNSDGTTKKQVIE